MDSCTTNGPDLPGSPDTTAIWAPAGNADGAGPHLRSEFLLASWPYAAAAPHTSSPATRGATKGATNRRMVSLRKEEAWEWRPKSSLKKALTCTPCQGTPAVCTDSHAAGGPDHLTCSRWNRRMPDTTSSVLTAWSNFYVIAGSSAAALTGLMFVVITLVVGLERSKRTPDGIATFSTPTVVHFCVALVISAILSAPWHSLAQVGTALGLTGLYGIVYVLRVFRRTRRLTVY